MQSLYPIYSEMKSFLEKNVNALDIQKYIDSFNSFLKSHNLWGQNEYFYIAEDKEGKRIVCEIADLPF